MKKFIVAVIVTMLAGVSFSAAQSVEQGLEQRAVTLVSLLEQSKKFTSTGEAFAYREKRENILAVAIPKSTNPILVPLQQAIVAKKTSINTAEPITDRSQTKDDFAKLINSIRKAEMLSALTYQSELDKLAQSYAVYIDTTKNFSHTSLSGETLGDRILTVDYPYTLIGENLARGYSDIAALVQGWMNSPTHRANILTAGFIHMGLGRSGEYRVHLFGRPK